MDKKQEILCLLVLAAEKSCRMIRLLFLLFIVILQYHSVVIAETYQNQTKMKGSYSELVRKGDEAYRGNRLSDAESAYVSALAKKETAGIYINLGHVYMMMQDRVDDAIGAYAKALDIEPENLKPVRYLGSAYLPSFMTSYTLLSATSCVMTSYTL